MSIEALLTRLAEAIEGQTALLTKMAAGGKVDATASAGKPAGKPAADKPADKPAGKPAGKPAAAAAKKTPSVAVISEKFAAYMKAGDEDDRTAAKANVKSLVQHYGAAKLTEIDPAHFPRLLEYLDAWEAGQDVEFDELDGDGDGDDDSGGDSLL